MLWWQNLLFSLIEGLTEYLPVSSTGHLMMTNYLLGIDPKETDTYIIGIQLGAILSVLVLYPKKFFNFSDLTFYYKLLVAFIPAAVLGLLFDDYLEKMLQEPAIVGFMLIAIGIVLLFIDTWLPGGEKTVDELDYKSAFIIGFAQCFAMIPGVSRSASAIIGGLFCKLKKTEATEFSFFLAVPTLCAAAGYKLLKNYDSLDTSQLKDIAIGNLISFVVAVFAIKFFINIVKKYSFRVFGIYRIIIGAVFLTILFL